VCKASWPAAAAAITLLLLTASAEAAAVQTDDTHCQYTNRITGLGRGIRGNLGRRLPVQDRRLW